MKAELLIQRASGLRQSNLCLSGFICGYRSTLHFQLPDLG